MVTNDYLRQVAVEKLLIGINFCPVCVTGLSLAETIRTTKTAGGQRLITTILKRLVDWRNKPSDLVITYVELVTRKGKVDSIYADFIYGYLSDPRNIHVFRIHFFEPQGECDVLSLFVEDLLDDLDFCIKHFMQLPLYT